ncbi:septal ring lytic transglycosylase RlpA family protein [Leptothermofonsia sp. ETS-13]|uniref:septal ring lytic transglycosylase RlpA family protein n=1 Tax=Leptothermofonsia sp. ETS-13 TaxID=3035696 RepID=UPI003BA28A40
MPIFGLVWVASWVGCFFSSSQDLLKAPGYPTCVLLVQSTSDADYSYSPLVAVAAQLQRTSASASLAQVSGKKGLGIVVKNGSNKLSRAGKVSLSFKRTPPVVAFNQSSPAIAPSQPKIYSGRLFVTLKSFLSGFQAPLKAPASLPLKAPTKVTPVKNIRSSEIKVEKSSRSILGRCSLTQSEGESSGIDQPEHFQVKFRGYVIGEVLDRRQATAIAQRLEKVLKTVKLQPSQLQPALVNRLPAVKLGDGLLFSLDRKLLPVGACNLELLAIQWTNNLRSALSEPPLSLVEAQERMYGLRATGEAIAGTASWYGPYFHGRLTATGEIFDQNAFTAAHPSLPFDTYLKVTNLLNGKSVIVRINDRGPYIDDRTLDLSREAARYLGSEMEGVVPIEAMIMEPVLNPTSPTIAML